MINYDRLEFKHLNAIIAIAETGKITAAAARLNIVQSALSRQVQEVEHAFNIRIFERGHWGTRLTEAGKALLRYAYHLRDLRKEVIDAVQAIHQTAIQPFRLGFTPFVEREAISTICESYRKIFPAGSIYPETADTDALIMRLKAGELDAALVTLPIVPDGYCIRAILHEPLVVCIRKDDPLAQYDELPPEVLNERLAIFSDPRHHLRAHNRLLEMLQEQGIEPRISSPTFNSQHVQLMVREGNYVALISQSEPLDEDLTTKPIQGVHWTIDSAFVYSRDHDQKVLPLLLRVLEEQFIITDDRPPAKKRPQSVPKKQGQQQMLFRKKHARS